MAAPAGIFIPLDQAQAILDYLLGRPAGEVIAHIQTLQQAKQIARAPK